MTDKKVYLKPNVVIEPLFDRWYAWPHLISPATAAMNIVGRHLKIMNSYLQAPHLHAAAVKNPAMLGGPFMDFKGKRVEEVKQLRDKTMGQQQHLLEFAQAIKELDKMLQQQATGFSLEPLYEQVPELLKGYIELVYDLNHHPSFRFFESLLYKSEYYHVASQSIALWITENDERPFVLSTPKLDEPDVLHLEIPFAHPAIDCLGRMKREAHSLAELKQLLAIKPEQEVLFETFFTEEAPAIYQPYQGNKIRMRYFGHACILIETKDVSILIDPLISYYGYHSDVEHYSDADLPDVIDYVLITHNHQDHVLFETLLPLRHKIRHIVVPSTRSGALQDPSLKLMFNHIGFDNVVELDEMETIRFKDCVLTGIPFTGEHGDLNVRSKLCYHVEIEQFTLLFIADSRVIEPKLYEKVHRFINDVDVLFLGMECDGAPMSWLYGPLLTADIARDKDNTRRLAGSNFNRGVSLVDIFKPKEVYVYAMGQEPWLEFISSVKYTADSNPIVQSNILVGECANRGITAERLFGEKELLYEKKLVAAAGGA